MVCVRTLPDPSAVPRGAQVVVGIAATRARSLRVLARINVAVLAAGEVLLARRLVVVLSNVGLRH